MNINRLRDQLDSVDDEILQLFMSRMELVDQMIALKNQNGVEPQAFPAREHAVLARIARQSVPGYAPYAKALFSTILNASYTHQSRPNHAGEGALVKEIRAALQAAPHCAFSPRPMVAYQGVQGGFAQVAADRLFPGTDCLQCKDYPAVFSAVEKELCQFGVVPLENSAYGSAGEVYELLRAHKFFIVRAIRVIKRYALLSRPQTELPGAFEVFAQPKAVGDCSAFLRTLPGARITVCDSDEQAAALALSSEHASAALVPHAFGERYGKEMRIQAVESKESVTRYACIAKKLAIYPDAKKISLMLSVPNEQGTLCALIERFAALEANLTKLESRGLDDSGRQIPVFLDLEAPLGSPEMLALLDELSYGPEKMTFLGNYAEQEDV